MIIKIHLTKNDIFIMPTLLISWTLALVKIMEGDLWLVGSCLKSTLPIY